MKGWRVFFLLWEISNTIQIAIVVLWLVLIALSTPASWTKEETEDSGWKWIRATAIFWGAVLALLLTWPFILWTELVVRKNNIVSETDPVSVYLFAAQVGTMVLPSLFALFF